MPQALREALNYGINYGMGYNRLCISQQAACQALTIDQSYFSFIRTNGRHGVVGDDHIQALTLDLVLRCWDQVLRLGSESDANDILIGCKALQDIDRRLEQDRQLSLGFLDLVLGLLCG